MQIQTLSSFLARKHFFKIVETFVFHIYFSLFSQIIWYRWNNSGKIFEYLIDLLKLWKVFSFVCYINHNFCFICQPLNFWKVIYLLTHSAKNVTSFFNYNLSKVFWGYFWQKFHIPSLYERFSLKCKKKISWFVF